MLFSNATACWSHVCLNFGSYRSNDDKNNADFLTCNRSSCLQHSSYSSAHHKVRFRHLSRSNPLREQILTFREFCSISIPLLNIFRHFWRRKWKFMTKLTYKQRIIFFESRESTAKMLRFRICCFDIFWAIIVVTCRICSNTVQLINMVTSAKQNIFTVVI